MRLLPVALLHMGTLAALTVISMKKTSTACRAFLLCLTFVLWTVGLPSSVQAGPWQTTPGDPPACPANQTVQISEASTPVTLMPLTVTDELNFTGELQEYTLRPGVTEVTIEATGGNGGDNDFSSGPEPAVGGRGARLSSQFSLPAGTTLQVIVGGRAAGEGTSGGGGGATFVATGQTGLADFTTDNVLLIAGGGGGASFGTPGSNSTALDMDAGGPAGSSNELGGAGQATGGGSLLFTAGTVSVPGRMLTGGQAAVSGAAGGVATPSESAVNGGYGGGGAASNGGGGGGGARGGAGNTFSPGGAGTSFRGGTAVGDLAFNAQNDGNGQVRITYASPLVADQTEFNCQQIGEEIAVELTDPQTGDVVDCQFIVTVVAADPPHPPPGPRQR